MQMSLIVYFNFDGNSKDAAEFYANVFQAEPPKIMLFGDMPSNNEMPMDEETKKRVIHGEVKLKDTVLMFSDTMPGMPFQVGNNITLMYGSKDQDEIKTVFERLKEGGTVNMELQETFWSKCYGSLVDKFGVVWQLNVDSETM